MNASWRAQPPDKICQLVDGWFAAQLGLKDAEIQLRLLIGPLRRLWPAEPLRATLEQAKKAHHATGGSPHGRSLST
jgi:hypothetical protein